MWELKKQKNKKHQKLCSGLFPVPRAWKLASGGHLEEG